MQSHNALQRFRNLLLGLSSLLCLLVAGYTWEVSEMVRTSAGREAAVAAQRGAERVGASLRSQLGLPQQILQEALSLGDEREPGLRPFREGLLASVRRAGVVVLVIDAGGAVERSTDPSGPNSIENLSLLRHHQLNADRAMHVSEPISLSGLQGRYIVLSARRNAGRRFDGLVAVAVPLSLIEQNLAANEAPAARIQLLGARDEVLARGRSNAEPGTVLDLATLGRRSGQSSTGIVPSPVDEHPVYFAQARLSGMDLKVVYELEASRVQRIAGEVRNERILLGVLTIALIALFTTLILRLARILDRDARTVERMERALRLCVDNLKPATVLSRMVRDRRGRIVDFQIVDCNAAMAQFIGKPANEAIDALATDVAPRMQVRELAPEAERVLASGQPRLVPKVSFYEGLENSGSVWVEHEVLPMRLEDDTLLITARDITAQARRGELTREDLQPRALETDSHGLADAMAEEWRAQIDDAMADAIVRNRRVAMSLPRVEA